jgi:uncharacterized membrane protein
MKFALITLAQFINSKSLPTPGGQNGPGNDTLKTVMDIVFAIVGAFAVLMVVIAGFRYIRAGSNETIVAESRRQLAHAIVGLIVAASAGLIVNFVLGRA